MIFHQSKLRALGVFSVPQADVSLVKCAVQKSGRAIRFAEVVPRDFWDFPSNQWPFQEPKLEVPTIYKAYVRPM